MYAKDGGTLPEPVAALSWPYLNGNVPQPGEVLREISGRALEDVLAPVDPKNPKEPPKVLVKKGDQVPSFAFLRDDGSTSCGNWIYSGCWGPAGNLTARRDTSDPTGLGVFPNWGYAWPVNRRILYNRASADANGKPWDPSRKYLAWNGSSWAGGADVPDMRPDAAPEQGVGAFIMNPEGVARLYAVGMAEGPFPEHYEPFETPVGVNLMCPTNPKAVSNPAARVYKGDLEAFGKKEEFPYAATTYRLTEHLHFWTKHSRSNAIVQPAPFVEIGEELAKEKGIKQGDRVKVRSNRGEVVAACVVTKRMKAMDVNGKKVHHVGIPIHWGFKGVTQNGYLANALTPFVGDANSQTPEYKAFLVNIEKA
jgi:anaerobic selenocysteine-containing dehydrogenase